MSEPTGSFPYACAKHPGVAGTFQCARCGNHFCIQCCYSLPDGTINCHECYAMPGAATAPPQASPGPLRVNVHAASSRYEEPVLPGQGCIQHPDVRGIFQCQFCGARSCPTCDFFFPPAMHVCPQCASTSTGRLTPTRRKHMMGALIAGGSATVMLAVAFGGSMMEMPGQEIVADILFLIAMLGAAIGAGLATASYKKGRHNSIGIWIGLVWNSLLILGVIGLIVLGIFMGDK
jgi:hypothetical protein